MTDARLVLALLSAAVLAGGPASLAGSPSAATVLATLRAPPGMVTASAPAVGAPVEGPAPTEVAAPRWRWPLAPRPRVVRSFDAPASPWGRGHRGLDLDAAPGALVRAVEAGTVTHAGTVAGRGTVTVLHTDGLSSTYEPVVGSVSVGTQVAVGDVLGVLEDGPAAHGGGRHCLHLGARRPPAYLDPLPLLTGGGRLRLMPLGLGP